MNNQFENENDDELRRQRWQQRMAEMKRQKEKRQRLNQNIKKYAAYGGALLAAVCVIGTGIAVHASRKGVEAETEEVVKDNSIENLVVQETSLEYIPEETVAKTSTVEMDDRESQNTIENQAAVESVEIPESESVENTAESRPTHIETVPAVTEVQEPPQIQTASHRVESTQFWDGYAAETTNATRIVGEEDVISDYAILMDASNGTIIAQRDAKAIINPASMTKVLTVLVAAEHVTNLDDEFTMTLEITDYAYVNDCSSVGFLDGETVTVRDLFYGTILPSGGDAAVALATYVAGSQEAFVDMMNDKLEELGLSETAHFTNCVGLYDEEHYCTVYDMAIIMKAAAENDLCREVMSARKYTTSATEQHPEGITVSNWFLRRIEDKDTGGEVLCAKTGFVNQSGSCAASYGISESGVPYICVTAKSTSSWKCIYDHVALYKEFAK